VPVYLTAAETALLALLIAHEGQAMRREELFTELKMEGNERTVDVQITRLRKKIEANPKQPLYIRTVRGEGYAFFS
jgi:two-component system phosphate regulon response regulator OmpR